MSLPDFSVRQIVFVNLSFAIVIFAGVLFAKRIPVDLYPDISFNMAIVTTVWSGASADEVERLVTTKLEDEIRDVDGIKNLTSFSRAGVAAIEVEWDETLSDIEYEAALNELRAAVDRVNDLPPDLDEEPYIRELSVSEEFHVVTVAVTDVGGVGEYTLREVARDLERRVERLPGVRKADLRGERDRELRVYVDRDKALQYDLTLAELSAVIARNNQNVPAGSLAAQGREITVRGLGNFTTPASLAATVVKKDPGGNHVRLGDLARVEAGFAKRRLLARHNGREAIVVGIAKDADADINVLARAVRDFVDGYQSELPPGVETPVTSDTSLMVRDRIRVMVSNLTLGIVLVMAVLWFTVGFRNALIVTVGIPFSFLCAFLLFPLFDITINIISLVGFVMVSGMLVDHAIVIVENIYRRVEEGEPFREAIVHGTEEVMWPVIATVATTLAAFTPMLMITGTSGEFSSILPKTVIVVLIGSLFEALVVLPAHYLDWGSRAHVGASGKSAGAGLFAAARRISDRARDRVDTWLEGSRATYLRAQSALLHHRYAFLGACVAGLWFSCGLQQHVRVDLFPSDFDEAFVSVRAPVDFPIEKTDALMKAMEEELRQMSDDIADFTSYAGYAMNADRDPVFGANYGLAFVQFTETRGNKQDPGAVLGRIRERMKSFEERHADSLESLTVMAPRHGPPIGKPVAVRIMSEDYTVAKQVAGAVKAELAATPGVFNIEDNVPEGPLELRIALHEHRASLHGLAFQDVATALRAANDGLVPSTFKDPNSDEDVDIRVLLEGEQRSAMGDLLEVEVRTPGGYLVKLGDVARVEVARGFQRLYHYDAERAIVVYADVDGISATSTSANDAMRARFADAAERFPGVALVFGGEDQETRRTMEDMMRALGIALLAIYSILATLFRSYLQPFVVMSVVGFAFVGVTIGLFVTGGALSMWVMYATVGLAGIVVNDSLVLMDFVNRERARGTPVMESVGLASSRRFRPILLTTVTTIAGLLPMSLGIPEKSTVFGPFATALVFGLSVASLLTLFVVPAIYLAIEDARVAVARRRGRPEPMLADGVVAGGRD